MPENRIEDLNEMPENGIEDLNALPANGIEDLNETDLEAPGGTQATHSTTGFKARDRVAERVTRMSDSLHRRALELELQGGIKSKAAPAVRSVSRAADAGAVYVRENDLEAMRGDFEEGIRAHPIRSMAIALGAGYLLARLLD